MNTATYTQTIFGGPLEVKRLYAQELEEQIKKNGLSPEEFDEITSSLDPDFSKYWPRAGAIIDNPELFTPDYNQALGWKTLFGGPRGTGDDRVSQLSGTYVTARIKEFLKDPKILNATIDEFHASGWKISHVTLYPAEASLPDSVPRPEVIREGSPNHIPKIDLAVIHIHGLILKELEKK